MDGRVAKNSAHALWYVAPGEAEIRAEALPQPAEGDVVVTALHGALSRGTEALIFSGQVPQSEYERMRGPGMGGTFPFPVKYGYATVGRVDHGPADLGGRTVFALHPHQTRFVLPASAIVPVPDAVPPARAVLAANMETALNAVWDAGCGPASRIAVIGAGVVGALVAWLCGEMPGADVTMVDTNPAREDLAAALDVAFAQPDRAPGNCDVVFHASASPAGLATALSCAGDEAAVVEMSWYGDRVVTASLGGAFHSRRLRLVSSQVGSVAPGQRPRWSHRRRLQAALALLKDARLDALLEPPIAFHDLPARLPALLAPGSGVLCQRIDYGTGAAAAG